MSAKVSATRDGEPSRVANLFCQPELQERETAPPPTDAEIAQTVKATKILWEIRHGFTLIPGTIERDNGDDTYDITWTYGGSERDPGRGKRVEKARIHPASEEWRMWLDKLNAGENDLTGANFMNAELTGIDFLGINLTNARFDGSKIVKCSFGMIDPVTGKYCGFLIIWFLRLHSATPN